jgi:hypothetical protein
VVDSIDAPAGAVGLLSSEEFTPLAEAFDRDLIGVFGPRVAVLLAADPDGAAEAGAAATRHYLGLGAEPVILAVLRREDATADALPECDVLFLAGGDPANLLRAMRETPFWRTAVARWRRGMALAGSSAGAMALCRHCLVPRPGDDKPTVWDEGLGPLERFGLAVHASTRPVEWLARVVASAPVPVVALDDATGLILRPARPPSKIGSGAVRVRSR